MILAARHFFLLVQSLIKLFVKKKTLSSLKVKCAQFNIQRFNNTGKNVYGQYNVFLQLEGTLCVSYLYIKKWFPNNPYPLITNKSFFIFHKMCERFTVQACRKEDIKTLA